MHTFWVILGVWTGIGGACFLMLCLLNMLTLGGMLFMGGKTVLSVLVACLLLGPLCLPVGFALADDEY